MRTWANSYAIYDRATQKATVINHRDMSNMVLCDEEIYLDVFEYEAFINPKEENLFQACLNAMTFEMDWVDIDDKHYRLFPENTKRVYVVGNKRGKAICCTKIIDLHEILKDPYKYLYAVYRKAKHEGVSWEINYLMKNYSMTYVDAKNASKGKAVVTSKGIIRARHEIPPVGAEDRYHYDMVILVDGNEFKRLHTPTELSWEDTDSVLWKEEHTHSDEEHYAPSATNHDYSPSNPWDAPGMSIRDFI